MSKKAVCDTWISLHPKTIEANAKLQKARRERDAYKPTFVEEPRAFVERQQAERWKLLEAVREAKYALESVIDDLRSDFEREVPDFDDSDMDHE